MSVRNVEVNYFFKSVKDVSTFLDNFDGGSNDDWNEHRLENCIAVHVSTQKASRNTVSTDFTPNFYVVCIAYIKKFS
jgi:hypothetical protein